VPAGTRNQQIGRNNIYLRISTNQSRQLFTFLPDMSAPQKLHISIGQRSRYDSRILDNKAIKLVLILAGALFYATVTFRIILAFKGTLP
jgi:hypothetical protein